MNSWKPLGIPSETHAFWHDKRENAFPSKIHDFVLKCHFLSINTLFCVFCTFRCKNTLLQYLRLQNHQNTIGIMYVFRSGGTRATFLPKNSLWHQNMHIFTKVRFPPQKCTLTWKLILGTEGCHMSKYVCKKTIPRLGSRAYDLSFSGPRPHLGHTSGNGI